MIQLFLGLLIGGAIGYGATCIPRSGGDRKLLNGSPLRGLVVGALIGLLVGATLGRSGRVAHPSPYLVVIDNAAQFNTVLGSNRVVLADFSAEWCGPCLVLKPTLHELADTFHGRAVVAAVDVDRCRELAVAYGVGSIPDVRLFVDGRAKQTWVGGQDRAVYAAALEAAVVTGDGR